MKIPTLAIWNLFFVPFTLGQNFKLKFSALAPVSTNRIGNSIESYEVAIYRTEVGGLPSQSIGVWFRDGKLLQNRQESRVWDIVFSPPDAEGRVYVYSGANRHYYGLLRFLGDDPNEVPYLGQRHQLGIVYGPDDRRYANEPTRFTLEDGQLKLTEYAGSTTNNNTISACYAFSVYSTDEQYMIIAGEITSTLFYHCEPIVFGAVSTNLPFAEDNSIVSSSSATTIEDESTAVASTSTSITDERSIVTSSLARTHEDASSTEVASPSTSITDERPVVTSGLARTHEDASHTVVVPSSVVSDGDLLPPTSTGLPSADVDLRQNFTLRFSALAPVLSETIWFKKERETYDVAVYNTNSGLPSQAIGVWFRAGRLLQNRQESRVWDVFFTPPDSEGRVYVYRASDGQYYGLLRFFGEDLNEVPRLFQRYQLGIVSSSNDQRYIDEPTRFTLENGQLKLIEYAGSTTKDKTINVCYTFNTFTYGQRYIIIAGEVADTRFYHCEPIVLSAASNN